MFNFCPRYLACSEAIWRMLGFALTKRSHSVIKLACHKEGEHQVVFEEGKAAAAIDRGSLDTTLTAWLKANGPGDPEDQGNKLTAEDRDVARNLTYDKFPEEFVFVNHRWQRRKQGKGKTIGRVPVIALNLHTVETYALRVILHNKPGATSFEDLRTVGGVLQASYQAAAIAMGLMEDDRELDKAVDEAAAFKFGEPIRSLFLSILLFSTPSDPLRFYNDHKHQLTEDWSRDMDANQAENRSNPQSCI